MVAKILSDQKLDPTIINGGVINSLKSNAKLGKGDWAILEADESDGSFLKLPINYSIVTNITTSISTTTRLIKVRNLLLSL